MMDPHATITADIATWLILKQFTSNDYLDLRCRLSFFTIVLQMFLDRVRARYLESVRIQKSHFAQVVFSLTTRAMSCLVTSGGICKVTDPKKALL